VFCQIWTAIGWGRQVPFGWQMLADWVFE